MGEKQLIRKHDHYHANEGDQTTRRTLAHNHLRRMELQMNVKQLYDP